MARYLMIKAEAVGGVRNAPLMIIMMGWRFSRKGGRHVIAINNEYANRSIIYGNRASGLPETADDIFKGKMAYGI